MSRCKGFTLIELIIVLAIVGVLVGLLYPSLTQSRKNATINEGLKTQEIINKAVVQYFAFEGRYPLAAGNSQATLDESSFDSLVTELKSKTGISKPVPRFDKYTYNYDYVTGKLTIMTN